MRLVLVAVVVALAGAAVWYLATRSAPRPRLSPPTPRQAELARLLRSDVEALTALGPRNVFRPEALEAAARHIERSFLAAGYEPMRQTYQLGTVSSSNVEVDIAGSSKAEEIVIVGAHYDSVFGSPGADDNASGVAALLAIARRLGGDGPARTVRLVAFVNEEPPHFTTPAMGSYQYAERSHRRGENIVAMLSLESIGYYSDRRGSQSYPALLGLFYPSTGDFLGFAGNLRSRELVKRSVRAFREASDVPAESAALPELIPQIGWSDQWSFWQFGWSAIMVTDTALFRNPHYHMPTDAAETLDYDRLARVVEGLVGVVRELGF
ncbi:MAG TPA: M28 family peptidase [Thermoanaerobaculia bacterium]|nr:M28 family peptidase [Thermoanaerobaculia bacterium]